MKKLTKPSHDLIPERWKYLNKRFPGCYLLFMKEVGIDIDAVGGNWSLGESGSPMCARVTECTPNWRHVVRGWHLVDGHWHAHECIRYVRHAKGVATQLDTCMCGLVVSATGANS